MSESVVRRPRSGLTAEERELWERLTFSNRPVWFAGAEALLESYVTTVLQVQGLDAALRKTKPVAVPSTKDLLTALIGTIILISAHVVGMAFIQYLNAHSWRVTRFPSPTNSALQYFDGTIGMVFVGLSEEVVFRFYLINLLLLRGMSPAMAIIVSTLIFGGIHWSYGAGAVVFATLAGLVLSIIFMSTRNLIAPIMAHAAFDAFYFAGGVAFLWRIYNRAW
jgi:membrane protease YdiL (CAAX protease family)